MIRKLKDTEARFLSIQAELARPDVIADPEKSRLLMKEYKNLSPVIETYHAYQTAEKSCREALEILQSETDPDLLTLARQEQSEAKIRMEEAQRRLKTLLLPKDPNDERGVMIEIRAGAGGEEAALFAGVLFRMYTMFAQNCGWKCEIVSANETELGGFKEVSFMVEGDSAFSKLKFESGVHRVQRVPQTESQGRIQTSTVTVAVLPQAEDVEVEISDQDLEIDTHRASGAGGQHINKTDSAIRILHKPSGIVVECQDERSQLKNKEKALRVLRTKLYQAELDKQNQKIASERRDQIGTGDRSERIRTYNYPQSRVTDHRIGLTLHSLDSILNGKLDDLIDALATASQMKKLETGDAQ